MVDRRRALVSTFVTCFVGCLPPTLRQLCAMRELSQGLAVPRSRRRHGDGGSRVSGVEPDGTGLETPSRAAPCLGPQARWIARCAVSRSGWECPGSGFDSNPPYKKLCFTGETRILASRLSVSGILGLCIEVDPVVHEPCIPVTVWRVWRNVAPSPIILR